MTRNPSEGGQWVILPVWAWPLGGESHRWVWYGMYQSEGGQWVLYYLSGRGLRWVNLIGVCGMAWFPI